MHNLEGLLPELLGLIFAKLCIKERCRVIPLVSKELNKIHNDHLPQPYDWEIAPQEGITDSRVQWFAKSASKVGRLCVHECDYQYLERAEKVSGIPQLLCAAESAAPRLYQVDIGAMHYCSNVGEVMSGLSRLTNLCNLELSLWNLEGAEQLASLQRLQNLDVHLDLRNLSKEIAQSFWTVLAQLTALSQLLVGVIEMAEVDFWRSLPLLTQLRCLKVWGDSRGCMDEQGELHKSFSALKLSSLQLAAPRSCYCPFANFSMLKHLELSLRTCEDDGQPHVTFPVLNGLHSLSLSTNRTFPIPLQHVFLSATPGLHKLKSLRITESLLADFSASSAAALLSLTALALDNNSFTRFPEALSLISTLSALSLEGNTIKDIPGAVVTSLKCLIYLNLDRNACSRIPAALAQVSNLHHLRMSDNINELTQEDLNVLVALPSLEFLALGKKGNIPAQDRNIRTTIFERLPKVYVHMESAQEVYDMDHAPA